MSTSANQRIVIAGGHGKIALRLTELLHARGDSVGSIIRKPAQVGDVQVVGADAIVCDLESVSSNQLAETIGSADAVVFAAGAGPGSGPERKKTVDYGAAAKLIEASKKNSIDRYLMISAVGANSSAKGDDTYAVYLRAKGRADDDLIKSGLDYTIVRPTRLTDEPGDGKVRIGDQVGRGTIPRDDVAAVVAAALREPSSVKKVFQVTDGNELAAEALKVL